MSATLDIDQPIWWTAFGVVVGYGIVLAVIFVLFFLVPYGLFLSA